MLTRRAGFAAALALAAACAPGLRGPEAAAPQPAPPSGAARPAPSAAPVPAAPADALPKPKERIAPPLVAYRLGLMPLAGTGVADWHTAHADWDGRGTLIAILDTGVDPSVPGLQTTSTGQAKILDLRNFSGEGDIALAPVRAGADGTIGLPGGLALRGAECGARRGRRHRLVRRRNPGAALRRRPCGGLQRQRLEPGQLRRRGGAHGVGVGRLHRHQRRRIAGRRDADRRLPRPRADLHLPRADRRSRQRADRRRGEPDDGRVRPPAALAGPRHRRPRHARGRDRRGARPLRRGRVRRRRAGRADPRPQDRRRRPRRPVHHRLDDPRDGVRRALRGRARPAARAQHVLRRRERAAGRRGDGLAGERLPARAPRRRVRHQRRERRPGRRDDGTPGFGGSQR